MGEQMFMKTVTCSYFSIYWIESVFLGDTPDVSVSVWVLSISSSTTALQEEEGGRRAEVWAAQHAAGKEDGGKDVAGCSGSQI